MPDAGVGHLDGGRDDALQIDPLLLVFAAGERFQVADYLPDAFDALLGLGQHLLELRAQRGDRVRPESGDVLTQKREVRDHVR